ncbi:MAG TPA: hypothetical protein VFX49_18050 [Chloroflexota bacterium]|nr:hypothetical protein [Chloroflexota bacterium]
MTAGLSARHAPPLDLPLRFLAVGVASFALMALVYPWHVPLLLGAFYDPHLTAFVHVNTLGVIGAGMMGASYQLLPVVLGVPLGSIRLARMSWWLLAPGVVAFVLGLGSQQSALVAIGGALAFGAVALYLGVVVKTLARERHPGLISWHVSAGCVGLAWAAVAGLLLALSKRVGFLEELTYPALAAHATLMLGGWVTPMLMGVSYRLVGMFTLSEDALRWELALAALATTVLGAWTTAAALLTGLGNAVLTAGAVFLFTGQVLFAAQLFLLYRHRRRRTFDVHMPFSLAAAVFGLAATTLLVQGFAQQRAADDGLWRVAAWWTIAGWAQTSIQGFFYKIGTFLTWLHRFAPLAGKQRVPRLDDLFGRRVAMFGWGCWVMGVALGGLAPLLGAEALAVTAGVAMSAGAGAFVVNAVRIGRHWLPSRRIEVPEVTASWTVLSDRPAS